MDYEWLVGIDWGDAQHEVCVLGRDKKVVARRTVKHSGADLRQLGDELVALSNAEPARMAVGIETPRGAVVSTLLERGIHVYSVNPKQLDRFRDRHTVSGSKDDRKDAFVLADSLRSDLSLFRRVKLGDADQVQLRELVRMHEELKDEAIRLGNRLRDQLQRYCPQVVELGSVHDSVWLRALVERAPTPEEGRRLALAKIRTILDTHHIKSVTAEDVRKALKQPALVLAPGVLEASKLHVQQLLPRLRLIDEQKREVRRAMDGLLARLVEPADDEEREHRDAEVLLSLPGVGTIVCATMLAEAWQPLAERDYRTLRAHCGVAPVTRQSGKSHTVTRRTACSKSLVNAMYYWALSAIRCSPSAKERYRSLRAQGKTVGRALRGVADRLLAVLVAMLKTGTLYDENFSKPT